MRTEISRDVQKERALLLLSDQPLVREILKEVLPLRMRTPRAGREMDLDAVAEAASQWVAEIVRDPKLTETLLKQYDRLEEEEEKPTETIVSPEEARLRAMVERIKRMDTQTFVRSSSFHLSLCWCNAPMWQQPCTICGYYPDWSTRAPGTSYPKGGLSRDEYVKTVERYGNIAAFYFESKKNSVAYQEMPVYRTLTDRVIAEALASTDWPEPGEVWDFLHGRETHHRHLY